MNKRLTHFANDGFGWYCISCADAETAGKQISRLLTEGESESKAPEMSSKALAKWSDKAKTALKCTGCSITESLAD